MAIDAECHLILRTSAWHYTAHCPCVFIRRVAHICFKYFSSGHVTAKVSSAEYIYILVCSAGCAAGTSFSRHTFAFGPAVCRQINTIPLAEIGRIETQSIIILSLYFFAYALLLAAQFCYALTSLFIKDDPVQAYPFMVGISTSF